MSNSWRQSQPVVGHYMLLCEKVQCFGSDAMLEEWYMILSIMVEDHAVDLMPRVVRLPS